MNKQMRRLFPMLFLGLLTMAMPALGAEYEIDTAHSAIAFKIKHLTISSVKGTFDDFSGTFTFDPASPASASVEAVIQTASISTGNEKRDEHLRAPDFFDAAQFPTITFKSTGLTMSSPTEGVLKGNLTMHGVTKEVALALTFNGTIKDPWGNDKAGFSASGKVDRTEFGLSYGKVMEGGGLMIGNDVEFNIEIEATAKK